MVEQSYAYRTKFLLAFVNRKWPALVLVSQKLSCAKVGRKVIKLCITSDTTSVCMRLMSRLAFLATLYKQFAVRMMEGYFLFLLM